MDKMMGMQSIHAYCGLICSACPAYIATQADDQAALERIAAKRREKWNVPEVTAESLICDGCMAGGRLSGYCSTCEIRACGVARGVINCAHCADYACERLEGFLRRLPRVQAVLDEISRSSSMSQTGGEP
jgi:hypothetical protein